MPDLRLTSPLDGDLLNYHDGRQTTAELWVTVRGTAPPQSVVTVNGLSTQADAGVFAVEVPLTAVSNTLTAVCGEQRQQAVVYWDRHAPRRYRYSTDDNIQFLKDLAVRQPASLFDNPYLAFWRRLHREYGLRVQHNIYWGEPGGFELPQLPDRWKGEWAEHADWLKLTFHAAADEPAKPYLGASAEQVLADYDRITNEIVRFAGEGSLSQFTTIHWGEATWEACTALAQRGLRGLAGYCLTYEDDRDGLPPGPRVGYYLDAAHCAHLSARDAWRDHSNGLWFIKHDLVCNSYPPAEIQPRLDLVYANPHRRQLMEVMIHEQYFCPFLPRHFQPDAEQRVEEAVRWLAERDYQSIFYDDGLLGSPLP
ncbi:MAG: hypothetical protein IT204_12590 [Fimbriimonadaceae bacterium]|nr:hypothetical protein [Fimbriimonadaceae bacterium]